MKVLHVVPVDGCLDSAPVREFIVEGRIDEGLMRRLARGADLRYFKHFPRPYFRIDRAHAYVAQGVIGSRRLRVTFSPRAGDSAEDELRAVIEGEGS